MAAENDEIMYSTSSNTDIVLYPNPNNGSTFNLIWNSAIGKVDVNIYDATGAVVLKESIFVENGLNQTISFNQKLSSGIYHVSLKNQDNTEVVRFVVSK
jgi:hypothetical protein